MAKKGPAPGITPKITPIITPRIHHNTDIILLCHIPTFFEIGLCQILNT